MGRGLYKCPHCGELMSGYSVDIQERYAEHVVECDAAGAAAAENDGDIGEAVESDIDVSGEADDYDGMTEDQVEREERPSFLRRLFGLGKRGNDDEGDDWGDDD